MPIGDYDELAREVMSRPARLGGVRLVGVDGPSGAGKTILARRLALGLAGEAGPVPVVHLDDLIDGWDDQLSFWPRLESQVLTPLRIGEPGGYQRYDWGAGRFGEERVPVPVAPVVILDGFSSARGEIRPELTMAIFITVPPVEGLHRALARDGIALRPYLERWQRLADRHFTLDRTREQADLVVDGAEAPAGVDVAAGLGDHRQRQQDAERRIARGRRT